MHTVKSNCLNGNGAMGRASFHLQSKIRSSIAKPVLTRLNLEKSGVPSKGSSSYYNQLFIHQMANLELLYTLYTLAAAPLTNKGLPGFKFCRTVKFLVK